MKKDLLDLITIDDSLAVPVYKQIVESIRKAIDDGELSQNTRLPSVNSIADRFSLARGSVFSAYNDLRAAGLIDSTPGKGYYITSTQTTLSQKIFLLLDDFSALREPLYKSIRQHLPPSAKLDVFFHHNDKSTFANLIREEASYYKSFLILPILSDETIQSLNALDSKNVIMLDAGYKELKKEYAGVYQNGEKDIFTFLRDHPTLASKHKRLFMVVKSENVQADTKSKYLLAGFKRFAKTGVIETGIIFHIEIKDIRKGDAFIIVEDDHLVQLVQCLASARLSIGIDIGILSWTESILKSVIGPGITTVATDYDAMGRTLMQILTTNDRHAVEIPVAITDRHSF